MHSRNLVMNTVYLKLSFFILFFVHTAGAQDQDLTQSKNISDNTEEPNQKILDENIIIENKHEIVQKKIPKHHEEHLKNFAKTINLEKEIIFAQSGMFSGHFKLYGNLIQQGIMACFEHVNKAGGIRGKKLRLLSIEDYGDPEIAEYNIKTLNNDYNVDFFIGNMGTRSITKILPEVEQGNIALFFPWGGSDKLRDPNLFHIINGLGYLKPQIKSLIEYTTSHLFKRKIAVFHADGGFSQAASKDLIQELKKNKIQPCAVEAYNRFTLDITPKGDNIIKSDPKVVLCLSTSMPAVKLIKHFFRRGHYGTVFLGVDSTLFVKDILSSRLAHFRFTSSVPDAREDMRQITKDFRRDNALIAPEEEFTELAFAYYISASILVEAIKRASGPITKESVIKAIEEMRNFNLRGFPVSFDPKTRHAFGNKCFIIER